MMSSKPGKSSFRALTALVGIIATILVGWVLIAGAPILQPLVIAVLLCSVLQPVVRTLARYHIPSWATVILLLGMLLYGLITGGNLVYAEVRAFVGDQSVTDSHGVAQLREQLIDRIQSYDILSDGFGDTLINFIEGLDLTSIVVNLAGTLRDFMLALFLVVLYMIFIFAEQAVFRRKILAVAESRGHDAGSALHSISIRIQRYLGVKTVTSLVTAVLCYSVLLYLNLPYALLFGFMTYLLNYIPTFGSFAAAILPIATALATREGLTDPLIVAGTYVLVNVTLGSFLEPRLLGRELNLSPLVVILSVVVWAALWGITGTFLAVPLTATAQIILSYFDSTHGIAILLSNGPPREKS
jgi:predicted PurR-regulated permease PerM